jgi:hypothetical protein
MLRVVLANRVLVVCRYNPTSQNLCSFQFVGQTTRRQNANKEIQIQKMETSSSNTASDPQILILINL